ncbi:hypothetical protein GQ457_12G022090 [Hibiscus cannabinus]
MHGDEWNSEAGACRISRAQRSTPGGNTTHHSVLDLIPLQIMDKCGGMEEDCGGCSCTSTVHRIRGNFIESLGSEHMDISLTRANVQHRWRIRKLGVQAVAETDTDPISTDHLFILNPDSRPGFLRLKYCHMSPNMYYPFKFTGEFYNSADSNSK